MVEWIDWPSVRTVIEYGPGTGAFTERIRQLPARPAAGSWPSRSIRSLPPRSAAFPDVRVYSDSVANVEDVCRGKG